VQDAPVAGADAFTTEEDSPLSLSAGQWLANDVDVDGDSLRAQVIQGPQHGQLIALGNDLYRYQPDLNFNGVDTFRYQVEDGQGNSSSALVTLVVAPIEDALQATPDRIVVQEDSATFSFSVLGNDNDPDLAGPLQVIGFTPTAHGHLYRLADQSFLYQPDHDFFGMDSFQYILNSGDARIGRTTVEIAVLPVNDLPVLQRVSGLQLRQGAEESINANHLRVVDVEQSPGEIVFTVASLPLYGTLTRNAQLLQIGMNFSQADLDLGLLRYEHDGSWVARDGFQFTFSDQVSPQWTELGWFPIRIRLNVLPPLLPEKPPMPINKGVENRQPGSEGEWLLRPAALQEAAPILTAIHQVERSVALQDSRSPLLTAVRNSNPGVQDGGLITPVLNAVQSSLSTVAPGALQTPVLTAVMSESSQAASPILSDPNSMPGFAVRSGWFYFGPEFDLPVGDSDPGEGLFLPDAPEAGQSSSNSVLPAAFEATAFHNTAWVSQPESEQQGLYATIEGWEEASLEEMRQLLAVWA
ncbi:Ig-like domain-containing protein, partial [Candidatus Magnetaquicoccus inordinatus]|uniref:Ig-like domain-containing protein n=1 Tax=Candidatus Magnetaquicoccus inordinatus TaxID=2496818 RepID=UPI00102AD5BB